ncbi:MAG: type II toxin-antitoxin system RelE/ParE family toxin [Nitrospirae bacterium]|nr:type II toxin-antitoxin system RelE/ParE family toxin [Nitrospirota bacterium]
MAKRISEKIDHLIDNIDELTYKALNGPWSSHYRYVIGKWRIIFTVYENNIVIKDIGHRKDIYKGRK